MMEESNANFINKKSVETYTTKSFNNEGVAGSTPVTRMTEGYQAITPLPVENIGGVEYIAHNGKIKTPAVGNGVDGLAVVEKSQSASATGVTSNMSHS